MARVHRRYTMNRSVTSVVDVIEWDTAESSRARKMYGEIRTITPDAYMELFIGL